jgi:hypothetical protein
MLAVGDMRDTAHLAAVTRSDPLLSAIGDDLRACRAGHECRLGQLAALSVDLYHSVGAEDKKGGDRGHAGDQPDDKQRVDGGSDDVADHGHGVVPCGMLCSDEPVRSNSVGLDGFGSLARQATDAA